MSFLDIFKGNQYKAALESLQREYAALKELMTPEMESAISLQDKISELKNVVASTQVSLDDMRDTISKKHQELSDIEKLISDKKKEIVCLDEEILVQEFGLYEI